MGATTNEGTGSGAVGRSLSPIYNGVVEADNLGVDILHNWEYDINATGDMTTTSNVSADGNIYSGGNITAEGYVRGSALGQLLNTSFWTFGDGNVTNASGTYTDFASVSYTPVSASSHLLIEYQAAYTINGGGTDSFRSRITVDGTTVTYRTQTWVNVGGQDVRSGMLFPIAMVYANNDDVALSIKVSAARVSSDDTLTVDTNSAVLKISEFAI